MRRSVKKLLFLLVLAIPALSHAALSIGIGKRDITPPIGTPSAGYINRMGEGMEGMRDPLLALALFIDNGEKKIALCSVDHLGFTYEMVQEITRSVHQRPELAGCEVYIASSHTHSGGGAYLNIPFLGASLAGAYNPKITQFYIEKTASAIIEASQNLIPAKIGIGYGKVEGISKYRGLWPLGMTPVNDVAVIKFTNLDDSPLAVLFNYAVHPTVLKSQNRLFSSDFVGCARDQLQTLIGHHVQPIYFNGAQGDIIPDVSEQEDPFVSCDRLGKSLANTVAEIWNATTTSDALHIQTQKESYAFKPQATPFGLILPVDIYKSEVNVIIFNKLHAFITIPGELSSIYDRKLKEAGNKLGYAHLSVWGLVNDAHGYIILPESWQHKTMESGLSFGGESYGEVTANRVTALLQQCAPN